MTYATQQDLIDRHGADELLQLSDRTGTGLIDTVVVARALADADAEINGYLAGKYTLPLADAPEILVRLACDIARYHLYDGRQSDGVRQRYDDSVKLLKCMSRGEVSLGVAVGEVPPSTSAGVQFVTSGRVFNRGNLADY